MKRIFAAAFLFVTPAQAQYLNDAEKAFVALGASATVVSKQCGVAVVPGGLERFGDRTGADGDALYKNIVAMLSANANLPYERRDLDPAVTRFYITIANMTDLEIRQNKTHACRDWIKVLQQQGIIR